MIDKAFALATRATAIAALLTGHPVPGKSPPAPAAQEVIEVPLRIEPGKALPGSPSPLGVGVPFRPGMVRDPAAVELVSRRVGSIPSQVTVRGRHGDGSIEWIWLDFVGDARDSFALLVHPRPVPPVQPALPVQVTETSSTITVSTGRITVRWDRRYATPTRIRGVNSPTRIDDGKGVFVVDDSGIRGVLWNPDGLDWEIEDRGPVRAVLRVEGWLRGPRAERLGRVVARFHLYSGEPGFRVEHTLIHTEDSAVRRFGEVSVRMPLTSTVPAVTILGSRDAGGHHRLRDSGGWIFQAEYPHFAETGSRYGYGDDRQRLGHGGAAAGWIETSGEDGTVTAVVRDFAEQFPIELLVADGYVTARLWHDREGGKELDYRLTTLQRDYWGDWLRDGLVEPTASSRGVAKTHEIAFFYTTQPAADPATRPDSVQVPPVAMADPAWLCASGVLWPIAPKSGDSEIESFISEYFRNWAARLAAFPMTGWISWGMGPYLRYETRRSNGRIYAEKFRLNATAPYNQPKHLWAAWVRSGDREFFDFVRRNTRFLSDFKLVHWGGTDKDLGLVTATTYELRPIHWNGRGRWDTAGQTSNYIAPMALGYLLADMRDARDSALLFAEAVKSIDLLGDEEAVDHAAGLHQMMSAHRVTYDEATQSYDRGLMDKIHELAAALIDLNEPLSMSTTVWKRRFNGFNPAQWATYKMDHKFAALLDYHDRFGSRLAREAVIAAVRGHAARPPRPSFLPIAAFRPVWASQNIAPVPLVRAFEWTGDEELLRIAVAHVESALAWFRKSANLSAEERSNTFAVHTQGLPFFAIPHVLRHTHPLTSLFHAYPHVSLLEAPASTLFFDKDSAAVDLVVACPLMTSDPAMEPTLVLSGPDRSQVPGARVERLPATPLERISAWRRTVYRVHVPAAAAPGTYRLAIDARRVAVIASTARRCVVHVPAGALIGSREDSGFELARDKRWHFSVPPGTICFRVRVNRDTLLHDANGVARAIPAGDSVVQTGRCSGAWSIDPGQATFVQLFDLVPVLACGDPDRLFVPAGLLPTLPPDWRPPTGELGSGRFGPGLHNGGRSYEADRDTGVPASGTLEFWFRPDRGSHFQRERFDERLFALGSLRLVFRYEPLFVADATLRTDLLLSIGNHRLHRNFSFAAGTMHHVAVTWEPGRTRLFVDGNPVDGKLPTAPIADPARLWLGYFAATYDEVRLSDTVRYREKFLLPRRAFQLDAHTLALFPLDGDRRDVVGGVQLQRR